MITAAVHHLPRMKTTEDSAGATTRARRVLVVTFDFPPRRTSAVYRMIGLTRSLPQLGWQPTVLTIRDLRGTQDPQLLEKLSRETRIVRTRYLRVCGWEDAAWNTARKAGVFRTTPDDIRQTHFDRYLRLSGRILRSALYFPDVTVGWIPFALTEAIRQHLMQKFDLVYTTTPPRAAPVIGLLLKHLCRLPWVSEFMDPWYPAESGLRRKADDRLQSLLMREADRVVVMVQDHADELIQQFQLPSKKLAVVRNGFFEEDFASRESAQSYSFEPGFIHLGHFGTIYPGNEGSFFQALTDLLRRQPSLTKRVRLHIVGAASESVLRDIRQDVLKDIVRVHGFVPHVDAIRMMRACHCLLLFWSQPDFSRLAVAGKTYDYLRVGRPILAVTSEGGVKQLVKKGEAGWVVPPDNVEAIQRAVMEAIENHETGQPRPRKPEFVAQFRWDRQAEVLAETFREALGHGH